MTFKSETEKNPDYLNPYFFGDAEVTVETFGDESLREPGMVPCFCRITAKHERSGMMAETILTVGRDSLDWAADDAAYFWNGANPPEPPPGTEVPSALRHRIGLALDSFSEAVDRLGTNGRGFVHGTGTDDDRGGTRTYFFLGVGLTDAEAEGLERWMHLATEGDTEGNTED